jgi:myo-inositol catabolism protein IolS
MNQRKLGRTGLQISELGFGAWSIGGNAYGPTCDSESLRALAYAVDHGVNFFDTADTYGHGHSEKLIGEIFQKSSKRDQAVIASKVGWDFYHGGDQ